MSQRGAARKEVRGQPRVLLGCSLKRWLNIRLIPWLPSPLQGPSHLPELPQTRQQVCRFLSRYQTLILRPASDDMCAWTVDVGLPTRLCWSATGACTLVSDPSPAQSVVYASRGSLQ